MIFGTLHTFNLIKFSIERIPSLNEPQKKKIQIYFFFFALLYAHTTLLSSQIHLQWMRNEMKMSISKATLYWASVGNVFCDYIEKLKEAI